VGERATASAADGYPLAVTRYPAQGEARATMLFAGAMGVRQDFYGPFARYLAGNGVHVLTFDYRGMGWSRPADLRSLDADIADWAHKDLAAMLQATRAMAPRLPLCYLGHSLGGQLLGALPGNEQVRAALTVTAGSGWYRFNDRIPLQVRIFWFGAVPLLTPFFGYFPGKAFRMVADLPRGVAWQWRRWCLHPEYLLSEGESWRAAFDRVEVPVLGFSFEDDAIITRSAVDNLHGFYRRARVERRHVSPADAGQRRIGHFGFFAQRSREALWEPALRWLDGSLEGR
jgi:predicted alpha/beta hydrolase